MAKSRKKTVKPKSRKSIKKNLKLIKNNVERIQKIYAELNK
jgi:hypothetical protein